MLLYERRYSEDVLNIITHTQRSDISLLDKSHYITQMSLLFLCKMLWESTKQVFSDLKVKL